MSLSKPFGPGFFLLFTPNRTLYFLLTKALWNLRIVAGLTIIATRASRSDGMKNEMMPSKIRSMGSNGGDFLRFLEATINCCRRARFSETSFLYPPGLRSVITALIVNTNIVRKLLID